MDGCQHRCQLLFSISNKSYQTHLVLDILQTTFLPLQGVFNFLAYVWPKYAHFKKDDPELTFCTIMKKVIFENNQRRIPPTRTLPPMTPPHTQMVAHEVNNTSNSTELDLLAGSSHMISREDSIHHQDLELNLGCNLRSATTVDGTDCWKSVLKGRYFWSFVFTPFSL